MLTRRHFIQTTTALFSVTGPGMAFADTWPTEAQKAEWDAQVTPQGYVAETSNPWGLHPRFLPQRVVAKAGLVPGDIHVDAVARYLYHIEEGGTAMRYGVAIVFQGDGFLYKMVRNLVGTLLEVGRGKWRPAWVGTALARRRASS